MREEEIFLKSEADKWYTRNAHALAPDVRPGEMPALILRRNPIRFTSVLDVGASNGWRLEDLRKRRPRATYIGVEPSLIAVREGNKLFPKISLLRGVASALPVKGVFDLVLVISVFHWVSREKLLASVSEVDRCVAEGGYLLLCDFLPRTPLKNPYRHKKGVFTWKMDYGALFEATGNYRKVERLIYDYRTNKPATSRTPDDMREVGTLYQKKTGVGYTS